MDNFLEKIDHSIVLLINSCNTPILDEIMWVISSKTVWIPFYLFLIYLAKKKMVWRDVIVFVICAIVCVVFSDLISNYCFKNVFERYRPSHNKLLNYKLHLYQMSSGDIYRGGQYGFISSHAANFFAVAIFVGLALKKYYSKLIFILIAVATIVCLSRIYLGVHYFSDVFVGALVGSLIAMILYYFVYIRLTEKLKIK